ncbi:DEAD/DEAH box helicase, partial [Myroides injenensis]
MKEFPDKIVFKYSWRTYQQRVLDELKKHLGDNKLHIVAPPGSGKTVLGLEVMLRLNKPTLILAPTLAVRDQWVERFCELFLQVDNVPEWISKDLYTPKFLTVSTYQGLHAAFNNLKAEEEEAGEEEQETKKTSKTVSNRNANSIVNALKKLNVKTIIVDEAHHLKKEWWKSLDYLEENLKPVIVGLTATPPYDVSGFEWGRYISLNGPIDDEIFVPELVAEGDLCPHQDFIYFNMPAAEERGTILEMREKVNIIFQKLRKDEELVKDVEQLPFISEPLSYLEWIYENLEVYISCIVLINDYRGKVDNLLLEVVGNIDAVIPPMNYLWMEKLLNFYCFKARTFIVTEEENVIVEEQEMLSEYELENEDE